VPLQRQTGLFARLLKKFLLTQVGKHLAFQFGLRGFNRVGYQLIKFKGFDKDGNKIYAKPGLLNFVYNSRVNSLESIRRPSISVDEASSGGQSDFLNLPIQTNGASLRIPYEVCVQAYSRELAELINGLSQPTNHFIIRNLDIGPAAGSSGAISTGATGTGASTAAAAPAGVESAVRAMPAAHRREACRRPDGLPDRGRARGVRGPASTPGQLRAVHPRACALAQARGDGNRSLGAHRSAGRGVSVGRRGGRCPDALHEHRRSRIPSRKTRQRMGDRLPNPAKAGS